MPGKKVAEKNRIGDPNVIPIRHSVVVRVAEVGKKRFPCLSVKRFAVNQHPVHVEDNGAEGWKNGGVDGWKGGRTAGWKVGKMDGWNIG